MSEERVDLHYLSTTPKNALELFRWTFTEPIKLMIFSSEVTKKEALIWFIKVYPIFMFFSFVLYFLISIIIAYLGTESFYNAYFETDFSYIFNNLESSYDKLSLLLELNLLSQVIDFFSGIFAGVIITRFLNLRLGIASALFSALLAMTLSIPVIQILNYIFLVSAMVAIELGFIFQLTLLHYRHMISVPLAGITAYFFTLIDGAHVNIIIIFGEYFIFLGLHSYLYHFISTIFGKVNLENNPYLKDMFILIPIIGLKKKLSEDSFRRGAIAYDFSRFLFEFRPYRNHRNLAFYLVNIADASGMYRHKLLSKYIRIAKDYEKNQPTENFTNTLQILKNELEKYQVQNNIHHKIASLEKVIEILKELEDQMIREKRGWSEYYLKAIRANLDEANARLKNDELEAKNREPITPNIYEIGDPLSPNYQNKLFKGRKDVVDKLSNIIYTSQRMPLLLIQGQRRVGKTSLINYLEQFLGSGFKIVKLDMQSGKNKEFNLFVKNINYELNKVLGIDETINISDKFVETWIFFENYLFENTKDLSYKIIISFDEYEAFHKHIVKKHGEDILENMRSFMQSQSQVVFLFSGMWRLSDLTAPNWDEYFPQVQRLKVGYLNREDSFELIINPVDNFNLVYTDEVAEKVYRLTMGHPQLLQILCSNIVDIANRNNQKNISYEMVIEAKEKVFEVNVIPMTIFWREFCGDAEREVIEQILANNEITKETKEQKRAVARLIDYEFITKDFKIYVPLFEKWLKERRDLIEV